MTKEAPESPEIVSIDEETLDFEEHSFQHSTSRLWLVTFGILYLKVLVVSLLLYLLVIRSLALSPRKNNPTLLTVLFIFLTFLVDVGLAIEELLSVSGIYIVSTANCRFTSYAYFGNGILQALLVLFLLYYNFLANHFKTYRFETLTVKFYPLIVLGILFLEFIITIPTIMRIRVHANMPACEFTSSPVVKRLDTWMYTVLLPYWFPLLAAAPPTFHMLMRVTKDEYIEPRKTQVRICLGICLSYFVLMMMHYLLHMAREIEVDTVTSEDMKKLQDASVWMLVRPMFKFVSFFWHIAVPLICLTQDKELNQYLPRKRKANGDVNLEAASSANTAQADKQTDSAATAANLETHEYHNSAASDVAWIG